MVLEYFFDQDIETEIQKLEAQLSKSLHQIEEIDEEIQAEVEDSAQIVNKLQSLKKTSLIELGKKQSQLEQLVDLKKSTDKQEEEIMFPPSPTQNKLQN